MSDSIFISRDGERYGPYTREQCEEMLFRRQLDPRDMAWVEGLEDWRPLRDIIPINVQPAAPLMVPQASPNVVRQSVVSQVTTAPDETAAEIIGKMGCGCVLWLGLLALALGGGVVFPVLLILLPIAVIGGIVDMVKKLSQLSRRNRQY